MGPKFSSTTAQGAATTQGKSRAQLMQELELHLQGYKSSAERLVFHETEAAKIRQRLSEMVPTGFKKTRRGTGNRRSGAESIRQEEESVFGDV